MLVSLNVAINSYDYTLLSLLISNQFVEIKGCECCRFRIPNHEGVLTYSRVQEVREGEPVSDYVCRCVISPSTGFGYPDPV